MLRAFRVLSVVFIIVLMLANCDQLKAETYEVGPFQVVGVGVDPYEAKFDAYSQAYDQVVAVSEALPEGDEIIQVVPEYEGFALPTMYVFEFHILVGSGS